MVEILTEGSLCSGFTGPGWRILLDDTDPIGRAVDAGDEQIVVLDPTANSPSIRRLIAAGRQVVVVLPTRAFDRAVGLASELAALG